MTATTLTRTWAQQYDHVQQLQRDLSVAIIRARSLVHNGEAYLDAMNAVDALRDEIAEARNALWEMEQEDEEAA